MSRLVSDGYELVDVDALMTHPENPRRGDVEAVKASIEANGFYGAVVAQRPQGNRRKGRILAGNHRFLAARAAGLDQVPVVWVDVDDDEARRILLADNRTADFATYEDRTLAELLTTLVESDRGFEGTGWVPADLSELLERLEAETTPDPAPTSGAGAGGDDELEVDDIPPPSKRVVSVRGDLWRLGDHVLLCGDSFVDDDVDRLRSAISPARLEAVLTDPPFAIYGSASGISAEVADDSMVVPFFEQLCRQIHRVLPDFAHVYIHCDWRSYASLWEGAKRARLSPKNCLVWDKGSFGMGSNWPNAHEFVAFFAKLPPTKTMTSSAKTGQRQVLDHANILRFSRVTGSEREHNAAKPVDLLSLILEKATDEAAAVLDLFGGSGSTLIACERTGRRCALIEKDPQWCDVIVRRWQRLTQSKAVRETAAGETETIDLLEEN